MTFVDKMLQIIRRAPLVFLIAGASVLVTACDSNDGEMEQMGEKMDEQYEAAKDNWNEGVEEVEDEIDDHTTE
ncbi:hypothetical protein I6N98_10395 [Spongiibacter nanhainus]|uniref:Secreted protein n=1 Tax=Spongiibacter nanhainus TaxID=2794344 RepID=A0A7T4QXW5_9GAMM|nr:hypothetical protein [Spongiibacter nanhainus]QQD16800.1 hypothetical protein I6N98_10395 [Spongiibacter nanhainus]